MGQNEDAEKADMRKRMADEVEMALLSFLTRPNTEKKPPTYTEFLKLLELQKELAASEPKEIIIRWVEKSETESSDK